MPDFAASPSSYPIVIVRGLTAGLLVAALFWVGMHNDQVFVALTQAWQKIFLTLGLSAQAAKPQSGISTLVTTRSLPAVFTYSLLYTAACLGVLYAALYDTARMRLVLQLYAAVFGACTLLLLGGKLLGDASWAYQLGRRLIDFIVSPLPVIILVPLLRWYGTPAAGRR
ncbi:XrtX-associated membrane protein [Hymenobacter chitinivorans]|uniref:Uncharacterized protein n=1 Tax=Hymenobacter chitinivorans DSM 11115 TaxID=1121954 RepID=A0A2M9B979_9BACT|nr:hypothetical protein [Hymenobacter chitinivorans]PJJ54491.1 hypothetical protein CLV45_2832 [Hymenobacter chitinivorans DSM 11115]